MKKGVFAWYMEEESEEESGKKVELCGMDGYPPCAEVQEVDGSWTILQSPSNPDTEEEAALAQLAKRVNEDFQKHAKALFGDNKNVNLPGSKVDPDKLEIRMLLHNDGFHLSLAKNRCAGAPPVDLETIIKTGKKVLQEAGDRAVITT